MDPESEICAELRVAHAVSGSPGMGVLVASSEGILESCVVGERAVGSDDPVVIGDQWHWGSTGKAMTATLVARLVESAVIHWDNTIGEILMPVVPDIHPKYKTLTFRHLLSHTGGLVEGLGDSEYAQFVGTFDGRDLRADRLLYVALTLDEPPRFKAGERTEYTNVGYVVAAAMLETVTGDSWEELIRTELFSPLGISSAGFGPPGSIDTLDAPRGHRLQEDGKTLTPLAGPKADNVPVIGPGGSIHMSLGDYSRFLVDHLRGARGLTPTLLSLNSYEILHTPPFGYEPTEPGEPVRGYAMGWVIKDNLLYHSGSNTIWLAFTMMWPDDDLVVVVVANEGRGDILYPLFAELGEHARMAYEGEK